MRWESLFADLEARFELDDRLDRVAEVADRTRRERAQIAMPSRLLANVGRDGVLIRVPAGRIQGTIADVGPDWVLLTDASQHSVLVPLPAIRGVVGLWSGAQEHSLVGKRFTLGAALRGISRDRAVVELVDVDGEIVTGTIDAVGADHLDLAEHAPDEPRRSRNVLRHLVVPFSAVAMVRRR